MRNPFGLFFAKVTDGIAQKNVFQIGKSKIRPQLFVNECNVALIECFLKFFIELHLFRSNQEFGNGNQHAGTHPEALFVFQPKIDIDLLDLLLVLILCLDPGPKRFNVLLGFHNFIAQGLQVHAFYRGFVGQNLDRFTTAEAHGEAQEKQNKMAEAGFHFQINSL